MAVLAALLTPWVVCLTLTFPNFRLALEGGQEEVSEMEMPLFRGQSKVQTQSVDTPFADLPEYTDYTTLPGFEPVELVKPL